MRVTVFKVLAAVVAMIFVVPLFARVGDVVAPEHSPFDTEAFAELMPQHKERQQVSQPVRQQAEQPSDSTEETARARVDYRSDLTVINSRGSYAQLVGNVAFHHNGVLITCDTAYRFSENNMEGVGRVIINANDSTYIYGDRFTYDSESNIARIYSPIIKLVDGSAVLYTHNLSFNTLTRVCSYYGGGTLSHTHNLMESERGDYYTEKRTIVLVGNVEMHNNDYEIKSDSVAFDLNTELVTLYKPSDIWSSKGDFLHAQRGSYNSARKIYYFYGAGYVMTKEREMWANSIKYFSRRRNVELRGNIQILDTVQSVVCFGDYGFYRGRDKSAIMTGNPSVASFDKDNAGDTTFISADTMMVIPQLLPGVKGKRTTPVEEVAENLQEMLHGGVSEEELAEEPAPLDTVALDTAASHEVDIFDGIDTAGMSRKRIDKLYNKLQKKHVRMLKRQAKQERRMRIIADARAHRADSIAALIDTAAVKPSKESGEKPAQIARQADSSDYILRGFRHVKIYQPDVQSVCDSIAMVTVDSTVFMYGKPIVWNDNNQISASYLKIFSSKGQLDRAELYDYPVIGQRLLSDRTKYNQIRGKYMECYFKNNYLDVVYIDGSAETIFYKEEDGVPTSMFYIMSANMEMMFEDAQLSRLKWINDITHSIYPIDMIAPNQKTVLQGFRWITKQRPQSRYDVCNRKLRPSERESVSNIVRPRFLVTVQINQERVDFTRSGIWYDRTEKSPVSLREFFEDGLEHEDSDLRKKLEAGNDTIPAVE